VEICPTHKKGDLRTRDNDTVVILLCTTHKILTDILHVNLVPYAEEIIGECEGVFQRGRSTVDQIFTMRKMLKKCWELNTDVNHLFIDFQAAYEIGSEMHKMHIPPKKMCNCAEF